MDREDNILILKLDREEDNILILKLNGARGAEMKKVIIVVSLVFTACLWILAS